MDARRCSIHTGEVCGRYYLKIIERDIASELGALIDDEPFDEHRITPRFNIAPSQSVPVVRFNAKDGRRHVAQVHWGLIPSFAKDRKIAWKTINARAETVSKTPSYRAAFAKRRCLIPASGFYEWVHRGKQKLPHAFALKSEQMFTFAGLWENWRDPATDEWLRSCTIITTTPNDVAAQVHDRMPVILPDSARAKWLGEIEATPEELQALLVPYPSREMESWPVSPEMNKPAHDAPTNVVRWEPLNSA